MFALVLALVATAIPEALAQGQYTVWSSVVIQRTGERTPEVITTDDTSPVSLTSLGANQAYNAGAWFRKRYIDSAIPANRNGTNGAFNNGAPLWGLNADVYDSLQTYATSLDQQWNVATAQAFFQGLYPPFSPSGTNGSGTGSVGGMLDPTSVNAENEYVTAPLGGYQYPQIHTTGGSDPNFIFTSANFDCPAFAQAATNSESSQQASATEQEFAGIYDALGTAMLEGITPPETWNYGNAYAIYDYLSYQYAHNSTAKAILDGYKNVNTNTTYLEILQWLADEQQYAQLGNQTAHNPTTDSTNLPQGATGSISTIAGNYLVNQIVSQLQDSVSYSGEYFKLNLIFADFYPFLSLFSLLQLPAADPDFYGTPLFGSSAVFELFSYTNLTAPSNTAFPDPSDLYVMFYFRNGSDSSSPYQSYSLFNNGPSQDILSWTDFQAAMSSVMLQDVGTWCLLCGAPNEFCTAYNTTLGDKAVKNWLQGHGLDSHDNNSSNGINPAVAGVIGAIVALAVAALALLIIILIRRKPHLTSIFHRRKSSDLGGFKGGAKMASDQDLSIPKGGALGASVVETQSPMSPAHERVGSWELREAGLKKELGEDIEAGGPDEFQFPVKPVVPHERV